MPLPLDTPLRERLKSALSCADLILQTSLGDLVNHVQTMVDPTGELDRYCQRGICAVCKGEGEVEAHERLYFCSNCGGTGRIEVPLKPHTEPKIMEIPVGSPGSIPIDLDLDLLKSKFVPDFHRQALAANAPTSVEDRLSVIADLHTVLANLHRELEGQVSRLAISQMNTKNWLLPQKNRDINWFRSQGRFLRVEDNLHSLQNELKELGHVFDLCKQNLKKIFPEG